MKTRGFTMIEYMIVLAIVGIIAAVTIPAYQDWKKCSSSSSGCHPSQTVQKTESTTFEQQSFDQTQPTNTNGCVLVSMEGTKVTLDCPNGIRL